MTVLTCPKTGEWMTQPDERGRVFCGSCECLGMRVDQVVTPRRADHDSDTVTPQPR